MEESSSTPRLREVYAETCRVGTSHVFGGRIGREARVPGEGRVSTGQKELEVLRNQEAPKVPGARWGWGRR